MHGTWDRVEDKGVDRLVDKTAADTWDRVADGVDRVDDKMVDRAASCAHLSFAL